MKHLIRKAVHRLHWPLQYRQLLQRIYLPGMQASQDALQNLRNGMPAYGRVICRCETITEGEILDALHTEIPATTIDGVKRRCNAGMGRCQGGFCGPRVLELISRTRGIDPLDVLQDKAGSNVLLCETKQEGTNHD